MSTYLNVPFLFCPNSELELSLSSCIFEEPTQATLDFMKAILEMLQYFCLPAPYIRYVLTFLVHAQQHYRGLAQNTTDKQAACKALTNVMWFFIVNMVNGPQELLPQELAILDCLTLKYVIIFLIH